MWMDLLTNPVFVSVVILLVLAALRLNIVFSIIIAAFTGGLMSGDRKSTRLNSSHITSSRMPSSA